MLNNTTRILNLAWSNTRSQMKKKPNGQKMVHLDGFDAKADDVAKYKQDGHIVTGYLSIGSW